MNLDAENLPREPACRSLGAGRSALRAWDINFVNYSQSRSMNSDIAKLPRKGADSFAAMKNPL
jgi:hypothetical protein